MSIPSLPAGGDDPIVRIAVNAVQCFGGQLSRRTAAHLLDMWRYRRDLTDIDVAAVLGHFPEPIEAATGPGW